MIEFGETGPLSRFCLFREDQPIPTTAAAVLSDALAYLRASRQPVATRVFRALRDVLRRLTGQTTILFRVTVLLAIVVLATIALQQNQLSVLLQQRIDSGATRLDSFAQALARAKGDALTPNDLRTLRQDLGRRLSSDAERLAALEQRSQASGRVIAASMSSVGLLQAPTCSGSNRVVACCVTSSMTLADRRLPPGASRSSRWKAMGPWPTARSSARGSPSVMKGCL